MKEEIQNFDDKNRDTVPTDPADEAATFDAFSGSSGYDEMNYSVDGQVTSQEMLNQLPLDVETEREYSPSNGFSLEERLHGASTQKDYLKIVADLETFYAARVEALEGDKPATLADAEVVEFAQMIQENSVVGDKKNQPEQEISTTNEATGYLCRPGLMEGLSDKARKFLAIAFSATALAAAMPATAYGGGGHNQGAQQIEQMRQQRDEQVRQRQNRQLFQYGVQRGVAEVQVFVRTRGQIERLRAKCDQAVQSVESDMQFQIDNLQLQHGISLDGVTLLGTDAVEQFRERNPDPTPQQVSAFTKARQVELRASRQVEHIIARCNVDMQQKSQAAENSRTVRVLGDIPRILIRR